MHQVLSLVDHIIQNSTLFPPGNTARQHIPAVVQMFSPAIVRLSHQPAIIAAVCAAVMYACPGTTLVSMSSLFSAASRPLADIRAIAEEMGWDHGTGIDSVTINQTSSIRTREIPVPYVGGYANSIITDGFGAVFADFNNSFSEEKVRAIIAAL